MSQLTFILYGLIVTVLIIARAERLPAEKLNVNQIVAYSAQIDPEPSTSNKPLYNYSYKTDTDIQAQENGYLKHINNGQEALEVRGSYSYTDAKGNTFNVSYIANENGFQPEGAHIPTAPLIKKALQYIAEHPEENGKQ